MLTGIRLEMIPAMSPLSNNAGDPDIPAASLECMLLLVYIHVPECSKMIYEFALFSSQLVLESLHVVCFLRKLMTCGVVGTISEVKRFVPSGRDTVSRSFPTTVIRAPSNPRSSFPVKCRIGACAMFFFTLSDTL